MIIRLMLACICIFIVAFFVGCHFTKNDIHIVESVLYGFLSILGGMEIIALACIYFKLSFRLFFVITFLGVVLATVSGGVSCLKKSDKAFQVTKKIPRNLFFVLFVLVLLGQIGVWQIAYHTDEDDSFYVATATTTIDTDSLYQVNAYTGDLYEEYPARYVLSPFPVFVAFVSKVFGIRPVIVCHTLFPIVVISLSYGSLWMLSGIFFSNAQEKSMVLFLASVITTFSYYSTRIVSARLLLRPWQGKTLLASIVLPVILYFLLVEGKNKKMAVNRWCLLLLLMLSACFVSSMGIALSVVLLACVVAAQFIFARNMAFALQAIMCCVPAGILSLIYVLIR